MDRFLEKGKSKFFSREIKTFAVNKNGYLINLTISIANYFKIPDDYVIAASLNKLK